MSLVSSTTYRVTEHTAAHINRRIRQRTEDRLAYFAEHPDEIERRLEELDREWDMERLLEANAASFSMLGLTLGLTVGHRWFALPMGVAAFLLQHAVQGWCPPVPVFRRLGVRTVGEIDRHTGGAACIDDGVDTGPAIQIILLAASDDRVIAAFAVNDVAVAAAVEDIVAIPAIEIVAAALAPEMICG